MNKLKIKNWNNKQEEIKKRKYKKMSNKEREMKLV